jgi:putative hemolysin
LELVINLEMIFIIGLILANGLLAMSEIAIVASRKARLQQMVNEGNKRAVDVLKLAADPNTFLSTVQIGITLVGIFAGAFGGATFSRPVAAMLATMPWLKPYSDATALALVVMLITYISLVIGELVPKRIGLQAPEAIATMVARPMIILSVIASPAVKILTGSTAFILKLFGFKETDQNNVSQEEIKLLIQQGAEDGVLDAAEHDIVERVLHMGDRSIISLMTHRTQLVCLDIEDPWQANLDKIRDANHSMFPVCQGTLDDVLGVVHIKQLFLTPGDQPDLHQCLMPAVFMPETMPTLKALELFKRTSNHFALVTDEYGVIQGVITLTDIMEGMVGDIPTEDELTDNQAVQREDGSWLLDGMLTMDEMHGLLHLEPMEDDKPQYQTVGGLVMFLLERIPVPADSCEWQGWRLEVMDMDGNRVDKVLVSQIAGTDSL